MTFMQRQITGLQNWLRVETTHGTEFVNISEPSLFVRDSETLTHPMSDKDREATIEKIRQYVEDNPQSWENVKGYGARLSAPGYLDCTEWTVFDTSEEPEKYLEEMYPRRRRRTRAGVESAYSACPSGCVRLETVNENIPTCSRRAPHLHIANQ
jgi:hypothetical protein